MAFTLHHGIRPWLSTIMSAGIIERLKCGLCLWLPEKNELPSLGELHVSLFTSIFSKGRSDFAFRIGSIQLRSGTWHRDLPWQWRCAGVLRRGRSAVERDLSHRLAQEIHSISLLRTSFLGLVGVFCLLGWVWLFFSFDLQLFLYPFLCWQLILALNAGVCFSVINTQEHSKFLINCAEFIFALNYVHVAWESDLYLPIINSCSLYLMDSGLDKKEKYAWACFGFH